MFKNSLKHLNKFNDSTALSSRDPQKPIHNAKVVFVMHWNPTKGALFR